MSERRPLTHRQKQWIAGTGIALFVLLSILICWFAGRPLIHFAKEPELFRDWGELWRACNPGPGCHCKHLTKLSDQKQFRG